MTHAALLTALALIIFVLEAQIPPPVPIPGLKLGLANIITVYAMFRLGPKDTLAILLSRIFLGSVFAGAVSAMLFSLAGGLLCYLLMLPLRRRLCLRQIWVCGVLGAVAHNLGQTAAAILIYRTFAVAFYLPVLLLSAVVTGTFTGLSAQYVVHRMEQREQNRSDMEKERPD
ncbi:MAG: Gx transporter family protein [Oscillospiraceae bacterium]|nr:Gx transporter family protein [Oscillospiraceae bacterium]